MSQKNIVKKYLSTYAEPFEKALSPLLKQLPADYNRAIVIPAFNEPVDFLGRLDTCIPQNTRVLAILILNCPAGCSNEQREQTRAACDALKARATRHSSHQWLSLFTLSENLDWLVADLTGDLPPALQQTGVGFARKLGMDIALYLEQQGSLLTPWVHCSDADVNWPATYFCQQEGLSDEYSAIVLPHNHCTSSIGSNSQKTAIQLYDLSLRYYVAALRWCHSPWAYHTIGSTQVIHSYHYAANRGFPKREAGEDFYLLNKLGKTGKVFCPAVPPLTLSGRVSERVPFGTGPAILKILKQPDPFHDYKFYNPDIFKYLSTWCQFINSGTATPAGINAYLQAVNNRISAQALDQLGINRLLAHCKKQYRSPAHTSRQVLGWFDGFHTLKFIHYFRDNGFPSISFAELCQRKNNGHVPFLASLSKPPVTGNNEQRPADQLDHFAKELIRQEQNNLPWSGGI